MSVRVPAGRLSRSGRIEEIHRYSATPPPRPINLFKRSTSTFLVINVNGSKVDQIPQPSLLNLRKIPIPELENWDGSVVSHAEPSPCKRRGSKMRESGRRWNGLEDREKWNPERCKSVLALTRKYVIPYTYPNTPNIMRRRQSTSINKSAPHFSDAVARK